LSWLLILVLVIVLVLVVFLFLLFLLLFCNVEPFTAVRDLEVAVFFRIYCVFFS